MGSSAITSWQIDGETMETVTGVIFVVSKITMDGDYSYEIKSAKKKIILKAALPFHLS